MSTLYPDVLFCPQVDGPITGCLQVGGGGGGRGLISGGLITGCTFLSTGR